MPFISRVVEKKKEGAELKVTVRVTGVGGRDGPMKYRAQARALLASGFLPHYSKGSRSINEMQGNREVNRREDINIGFDDQIDEGNLKGVKERIEVARKEAGVFAQLERVMSIRTEKEVQEDDVEEVFGTGFFGIVSTYDYEFLVSTKYSF